MIWSKVSVAAVDVQRPAVRRDRSQEVPATTASPGGAPSTVIAGTDNLWRAGWVVTPSTRLLRHGALNLSAATVFGTLVLLKMPKGAAIA